MINKESKIIAKKYDRWSRFYDYLESFFEKRISILNSDFLYKLEGKILEVGVGTGKNLKYYNKNADVTAIDISENMLSKALDKSKKLDNKKIKLLLMDVMDLELEDNKFDYIITTFVFCSVPNPIKGLKEMKRVLKDNGKIIMVEHVLSKNPFLALFEHLHNPITKYFFGFNINRDTKKNILDAGLIIEKDDRLAIYDIIRKFTCKNRVE